MKASLFEYLDYRSYLRDRLKAGPRGLQTKLAAAMRCQGTYLIKVLREEAQLTEDQAFRGGGFFGLASGEMDYFIDLVRLAKAGDSELKSHIKRSLEKRASQRRDVKNRVPAVSLEQSLLAQIRYYSSWQPSMLHLATCCPATQTRGDLAKRFALPEEQVQSVLDGLVRDGLVEFRDGRYRHLGTSLHLAKDSPLHKPFQKIRREMALRSMERPGALEDLHFSSVFATSKKHFALMKEKFLESIAQSHAELEHTESEDVMMLVVDLFRP